MSGFGLVFAVFASVTIVSYGIMPMTQIAHLRQACVGRVVEHAVGGWGKTFVSVGLTAAASPPIRAGR